MSFDCVLKQVVLPNFNFRSQENSEEAKLSVCTARGGTKQRADESPRISGGPPNSGRYRKDYLAVFDWLRRKGVRRIIRVVVDDTGVPFHADETIENALEGFEVEIWDWKRDHVPISVIAKSSSDVREVSLYYSGDVDSLEEWQRDGGFANESRFPEVRSTRLPRVRPFRHRLS